MKHIFNGRSLLLAAALAMLGSCSVESPWHEGNGEGSIRLDLSASNKVTAAVPAVRAVSTEIVTPPVADFSIRVYKTDGSYTETFNTVADFVSRTQFSVGSYELEAWYGDPDAQGFVADEDEGYENAYYYGKTVGITVYEGQTTEVSIGATLANSIIIIEYSDAFKKYFTDWSTTLQTSGNDPVDLGNSEGESYVVPGDVNVVISGTLGNGKTLRLNPAQFAVKAGHMYKMRYNIYNGEVGTVDKLVIEFDENLETEPVIIDLSEEVENTPAPEVTPEGFTNGQAFVSQAGFPFEGEMKFNVKALAGIEEANLTVSAKSVADNSELNNISWLKKVENGSGFVVDLCSMSDSDRALMENDGVKAVGFFNNPGEFAELDLSGLISNLESGIYTFNLQIKDKLNQVNEAVSAKITRFPVEMEMEAGPVQFGEFKTDVIVTYNGPDPTLPGANPFVFTVIGDMGQEEEIQEVTIEKVEGTRNFESHTYRYSLELPDIETDEYRINAYFGGRTGHNADLTVSAPVQYPDYKVEIDPMTMKLRIKATVGDNKMDKLIAKRLRVYVNGDCVSDKDEESYLRDYDDLYGRLMIVYNLKPETEYRVQTTLSCDKVNKSFHSDNVVKTAHELPVPNGDFSKTSVTIDEKNVQIGGKYKAGVKFHSIEYSNVCNFKYSEPSEGWASINQKTFWNNALIKNSWFTVASTFKEGNEVVVRTVGYSHKGADLPITSKGFEYYCTSTPDSALVKASGELFLGTYSFNGSELRSEGIEFDSRPTSFSFDYTYFPVKDNSGSSSLQGYYEIAILDEADNVLVFYYDSIVAQETKETKTVVFDRYPFGSKAAKLKIKFMSSNPARNNSLKITVPTGTKLDEGVEKLPITPYISYCADNSAHAVAIGSVLRLSNLKFHYGDHQNK